MTGGLFGGRTVEVPCTVDVEHTPDSLHAFVDLLGIEVGPGDTVRVHDAPVDVAFGEKLKVERKATVTTAGAIDRAWTKITAFFELTELYEVSFTPRRDL